MRKYKQILEAINRGIQFALDDFESEEIELSKPKQETIYKDDSLWQNLELREHVVDLGLPSGTLWCKYNLDVDPNQLSKAEDLYGKYYAWGELEDNKQIYDWDYYVHGCSSYDLYKYVNNKEYAADDNDNKVDNLTQLLPEDDVAFQFKKLYNFKFHIPTKEQCEELINHTKNYWVNNYDPNNMEHHTNDDGIKGLNGRVFVGKNGNQLFIPAAGYRYGSDISGVGSNCSLWSSSLYLGSPDRAYYLYFYSDVISMSYYTRCFGFSVRPVLNL